MVNQGKKELTLQPHYIATYMASDITSSSPTIFTLPNGLRCVHSRNVSEVTYFGIAVNAGSRDDGVHDGLAHFVEHTLFKGTNKRKSHHISSRMESVGGELNAYTTKEDTFLYTIAPTGHLERAIELVADIVANSSFPASEINMEREVIIEEINSYRDSPAESVFDDFEDNIYSSSGMGHNILGSPESVKEIEGVDCRSFLDRFYTSVNMVVYCADASPTSVVERLLTKHLGSLKLHGTGPERTIPKILPSFDIVNSHSGHQAHTILGVRTFNRRDPRRFALYLLNNYLGGPGMNSRLNRELRDKRGYVYTVESIVALMSDCGLFQVYFGCDTTRMDACIRLTVNELKRLAESPLKPATLDAAKRQYCGQLMVSTDNREAVAMSLGKSLLHHDCVWSAAMTAERIREVKAEEVRLLAEELLESGFSRLTIC